MSIKRTGIYTIDKIVVGSKWVEFWFEEGRHASQCDASCKINVFEKAVDTELNKHIFNFGIRGVQSVWLFDKVSNSMELQNFIPLVSSEDLDINPIDHTSKKICLRNIRDLFLQVNSKNLDNLISDLKSHCQTIIDLRELGLKYADIHPNAFIFLDKTRPTIKVGYEFDFVGTDFGRGIVVELPSENCEFYSVKAARISDGETQSLFLTEAEIYRYPKA
jgi:hypothetical protein